MAGGDFNELWTAPEIFKGEKYTVKVDQYSFGIILWVREVYYTLL